MFGSADTRSKLLAVARLIGLLLLVVAVGVISVQYGFNALTSGEVEMPRSGIVVTPDRGAGFYYFLVASYILGGAASVLLSAYTAWRFLTSRPEEKFRILGLHHRKDNRKPRGILRSFVIFIFTPLVAIVLIMLFTILKS